MSFSSISPSSLRRNFKISVQEACVLSYQSVKNTDRQNLRTLNSVHIEDTGLSFITIFELHFRSHVAFGLSDQDRRLLGFVAPIIDAEQYIEILVRCTTRLTGEAVAIARHSALNSAVQSGRENSGSREDCGGYRRERNRLYWDADSTLGGRLVPRHHLHCETSLVKPFVPSP